MADNDGRIRYVICYDIPDDKRRTRLAKCLDGYGDRIQYSVFEALLGRALFDKLISEIESIINEKEDKVTVYFLCGTCEGKRQSLGRDKGKPLPGQEVVFIV